MSQVDWGRKVGLRVKQKNHNVFGHVAQMPITAHDNGSLIVVSLDSGGIYWVNKSDWEPVDQITPGWSGEGLPPVGTVCEYNLTAGPWYRCEVRHVLDNDPHPDADGWTAVIWCPHLEKEQVARADKFHFRPLRTPEQIAAEEREKAWRYYANNFRETVGVRSSIEARIRGEISMKSFMAGYDAAIAATK